MHDVKGQDRVGQCGFVCCMCGVPVRRVRFRRRCVMGTVTASDAVRACVRACM